VNTYAIAPCLGVKISILIICVILMKYEILRAYVEERFMISLKVESFKLILALLNFRCVNGVYLCQNLIIYLKLL
jgi:hypothetical protein